MCFECADAARKALLGHKRGELLISHSFGPRLDKLWFEPLDEALQRRGGRWALREPLVQRIREPGIIDGLIMRRLRHNGR